MRPSTGFAADPWWGAAGLEPSWILGSREVADSVPPWADGRSEGLIHLKRPIDLDFQGSRAGLLPCAGGAGLEVCAGSWMEEGREFLRVSGLSVGGDVDRSGHMGEIRASGRGWRLATRADAGDGVSRSGLEFRGTLAKLDSRTAASREERWADLAVASTSGSLEMRWRDVTDSVGTDLRLPVGPLACRFSVWGTSRGSKGQVDLEDQGGSAGWKVGAEFPADRGGWAASLSRENRNLSSIGYHGGRIFHEQQFLSARAEARIDGRISDWDLGLGLRELHLHVPQGGLDHPSISWNRLSSEAFATVYSALADRQDYYSGEFRIHRWEVVSGRTWERGPWKVRLGGDLGILEVGTEFRRRRLQVTGLIPAVSLDTLAEGHGWMATGGGGISLRRTTRSWGTWEWRGSMRLPVGGDWTDARSNADRGGTGSSLPLDPISLWTFGFSWCP